MKKVLDRLEREKKLDDNEYLRFFFYTSLSGAMKLLSAGDADKFPYLSNYVKSMEVLDKVRALSDGQVS